MATGTVKESEEKRKREDERAEALRVLASAMARLAKVEMACSGSGRSHMALLDGRLRSAALDAARLGLEAAYGEDDAAPSACPSCGGRERLVRTERPRVETALGSVRVEMARRGCRECRRSWRPRERLLDVEGSMTPTARRLASLAGSQSSYAQADELLRELSELNFGAKRIERATRASGEDLEAWRAEATARSGSGGCSTTGSGTPAGSSTTITSRSTCGRRRAPATAPASWPRRGRRSCAGCSRRAASATCSTTCANAAATLRRAARTSSDSA